MKTGTRKSSRSKLSSKIQLDLPESALSVSDQNLLIAVEAFHSHAAPSTLSVVASKFLLANGARVISPHSEEIEFLKSAWMEQLRFSLLETMLNLQSNTPTTLSQILVDGYKELTALFFWPSCSPWCIYSSIFELTCDECPQYIVSGSTQNSSTVNGRSLCWSNDGVWLPMGHVLAVTPVNEDMFRKLVSVYLKIGLPLRFTGIGESYGIQAK